MNKDTKIFLIIGIATLVLIFGFAFTQAGKANEDTTIKTSDLSQVAVSPELYDLGSIPLKGGHVVKEFEIRNTGDQSVKIQRIATSCMCTTAKVKTADTETRPFGMESAGDKNPPLNLEIESGETAYVIADFDPAAHGLKGVGFIERSVYVYFSDPNGFKELKFKGTVVN